MFDIEAIKDAPKEHCAPYIDVKPQPVEVEEGDNAKFLARVSGYPRPKITWRINDTIVVTVSIIQSSLLININIIIYNSIMILQFV